MKKIEGLQRGMGIGGWLTNYKRFHVLPNDWRMDITVGDMEHFESYITERDIAYIASLGMDHVRLGFDQIVLEESPYVYRERIVTILHDFVAWCRKYGLHVVLNLHKAIGNYCDIAEDKTLLEDEELKRRFIALWQMLEDTFAGEDNVMFELLNEVRDVPPDLWNDLAERTLMAIRAKNARRRVIIGSTCWNAPGTLGRLRLYEDENVIYTFHSYEPFEFTHQQGVLQAGPLYYNRKMPYPCDDIERYRDFHRILGGGEVYRNLTCMDETRLKECLAPAFDFVKAHPDKILWCGEFGTIRHAKLEWRENWMRDMIRLLKEHDIPYCVWNYLSTPNDGNRFSLVDDDTRKILSEELHKVILGEV